MDEQLAAGYSEPCARCAELQWGVTDEGHFFCRNCHMVIERTTEVVDAGAAATDRISSVRSGPRVKRAEGGRQWSVCEGFQFILRSQAEALVKLGVHPSFKDEVLVHLWRLYLHKTHQAYTHTPVRSATFRLKAPGSDSEAALTSGSGLDSESGLDSQLSSCDSEVRLPSTAGSVCSTGSIGGLSDWSLGSLDSDSYLSQSMKRRSRTGLMSMRKTLALLHVALTWSRQSLTLSELLRLVEQGHVPYVNSYECFPEEMKLSNRDALIFRVQSVPSYRSVHQESKSLINFLQLPAFPPISSESPLHPLNLSLRLLTDLNLPDETAEWVESVLDRADLMRPARLTFDPSAQRRLPHYELLSAAAVIIALKLLFGLNDQTEWELSSEASCSDSGVFSLRRWYRLLQRALLRAQRRALQLRARRQWVPKKPFYFTHKEKIVAMKRRRVAEQLTSCFKRLSPDRHGDTQGGGASSFRFLWGQSLGADGPSLHHMTLEGGARTNKTNFLSDENYKYWHPPLQSCRCSSHFSSLEPSLPRSFLWLLKLVSFVLELQTELLFEAVLLLERRLLRKPPHTSHHRRCHGNTTTTRRRRKLRRATKTGTKAKRSK